MVISIEPDINLQRIKCLFINVKILINFQWTRSSLNYNRYKFTNLSENNGVKLNTEIIHIETLNIYERVHFQYRLSFKGKAELQCPLSEMSLSVFLSKTHFCRCSPFPPNLRNRIYRLVYQDGRCPDQKLYEGNGQEEEGKSVLDLAISVQSGPKKSFIGMKSGLLARCFAKCMIN